MIPYPPNKEYDAGYSKGQHKTGKHHLSNRKKYKAHQKYIQKQAKLPVLHKNALWLLRELAEAKCQKRDEAEELHFDSQNNISSIIETTNEYSRFMKRLSEKTKEIEQCIEMAENPKRLNLEPKLTYSISLINNIENIL